MTPTDQIARDARTAAVFAFLLGNGSLEGVWFGDKPSGEHGAYWWRKHLRKALLALNASNSREDILEKAVAVADKHVQRARDAAYACPKWSPAQAEWFRARDLGLDIADELRALKTPEANNAPA